MNLKKYIQFPILALCAFTGGFAAKTMLTSTPSQAANQLMSYFKINDPANPKGIEMYVNQGTPAQNFYAYDGMIRLQLGTYTAPGERNLPLVSLNDNSGRIRMLLRLAGGNEAPVLIFKDKQNRDRMVMGLNLAGDEAPFITTYDAKGTIRNRLHEVIRTLGYEPGRDETPEVDDQTRSSVIADLDSGKITADQARRILRGEED